MQRGAGLFPAPAASHFVSRIFNEQERGGRPGFSEEAPLRRILETKNRLSEFQITGLNRDLSGNRTRVYAVRGRRLDRLTIRPWSRGDKIRTCDLCVPNAALYQTEPRLDVVLCISELINNTTGFQKKQEENTKNIKKFSKDSNGEMQIP